jgi:DNA polymerase
MHTKTYIFIDFETYWSDEYSLANMPTQAYILDEQFRAYGAAIAINQGEIQWIGERYLAEVLMRLKVKYPDAIWVAHNAAFDMSIMSLVYAVAPKYVIDTYGMSLALLGPALKSASLNSVAQYLLGQEKGTALHQTKNKLDLNDLLIEELAEYCKRDISLTRQIFYKLIEFFPEHEIPIMTWVVEMATKPLLELDRELLNSHYEKLLNRKSAVLEKLKLNATALRSNHQFRMLLAEYGVIVDDDFSFSKGNPEFVAMLEHESPEVQALVAARLELKSSIEETRTKKLLDLSQYGPVSIPLTYSGASTTHRISGRDKLNFQNLPRGSVLRDAIVAPDACELIVSDLSQIELRIVLHLAGHDSALKFLADGGDLYSQFATSLYGKTITKADKEERHIGKEIVLGSGYGMGAERLFKLLQSKKFSVTREFCEAAISTYRTQFAGVPAVWRKLDLALHRLVQQSEPFFVQFNGLSLQFGRDPLLHAPGVKLPNGLWIKYYELKREDNNFSYTSGKDSANLYGALCFANIVQALARNICVSKAVKIHSRCPVSLFLHDEVVAVSPIADLEENVKYVHDTMTERVAWLPGLILGATTSHAKRYSDAK